MPTILWLHGFPFSSAIFEQQLSITGADHVLVDLPGFGDSPARDEELTMDDYAQVALDVLDAQGIQRAIFAGLSMGGYVCFAAARMAPQRVAGLILLDTRETADSEETRKGRFASIDTAREQGIEPIVESMLPKLLTADAPPAMVAQVREIMMSSSRGGVIAALRAMAERPDSSCRGSTCQRWYSPAPTIPSPRPPTRSAWPPASPTHAP
jgi:3-oxoadipate enol-lactonase